jgi:hypothetical protein
VDKDINRNKNTSLAAARRIHSTGMYQYAFSRTPDFLLFLGAYCREELDVPGLKALSPAEIEIKR